MKISIQDKDRQFLYLIKSSQIYPKIIYNGEFDPGSG